MQPFRRLVRRVEAGLSAALLSWIRLQIKEAAVEPRRLHAAFSGSVSEVPICWRWSCSGGSSIESTLVFGARLLWRKNPLSSRVDFSLLPSTRRVSFHRLTL